MKAERLANILEYISDKKIVTINELMDAFSISKATLNRDLTELDQKRLIYKTHGGAMSPKAMYSYEPFQAEKEISSCKEKKDIALAAMEYIRTYSSFIFDSGSTILYLAEQLEKEKDIKNKVIATNDLKTGMLLSAMEQIELIIFGGRKRDGLYALYGSQTQNAVSDIRVDVYFMGVDAVDVEKGITNVNFEEVELKRSMIAAANKVILLADHTKFDQYKLAKVCDLDAVDVIITDAGIGQETVEKLSKLGKDIIIAKK